MTGKMIIKFCIALLCCSQITATENGRESRKLFGGYKITPRFCKPTRQTDAATPGPNICMFNHECAARQGNVVGACMDGFLFGACCNLPGVTPGELLESGEVSANQASNDVLPEIKTTREPTVNVMSNGFQELSLATASENDVLQFEQGPDSFLSTGVTHPVNQETYLLNNENNEIHPLDFSYPPKINPQTTEKATYSTPTFTTSPLIQISISHTPGHHQTGGYFQKPMFRPKPTTPKPAEDDKYVLVPTITHEKPNKTQEFESIADIIQMLNESSTPKPVFSSFGPSTVYVQTTKKPPSTSYVFSTSIPKRPTTKPDRTTSRKPPSTSYIFSSTAPPKRTTNKRPTTIIVSHGTKPTKPSLVYSSARPSSKPGSSNKKPKPTPSSTYKPAVQTANVIGPSFTVSHPTKSPYLSSHTTPLQSSTPTVILVAPVTEPPQDFITRIPVKPVTQLTINNIVTATNNYHFTTQRPPSPTVHITPKPALLNTAGYVAAEYGTIPPDFDSPANNDLINFPPVRNPNLNISSIASAVEEDFEFTTPFFQEDAMLEKKVENFVSKIVMSLQDPFNELKDIVFNKNRTTTSTTKAPIKKTGTTKKPAKGTSPKPQKTGATKPPTARPTPTKAPSRRPTTRKPTVTTRRPVTSTTKRPKTTRRTTTTPAPEEDEEEEETLEDLDYRKLTMRGRAIP